MMMILDVLPEECWELVASFLPAPDVQSWVSSSRRLHQRLALSPSFWIYLWQQQHEGFQYQSPWDTESDQASFTAEQAKERYLLGALTHKLPTVKWLSLQNSVLGPSAREGHSACHMAVAGFSDNVVVVTGGYSDDRGVYCKDLNSGDDYNSWVRVHPVGPTTFTYGASLTRIGASKAVRFGGFQSGGYSGETSEVAVLELSFEPTTGLKAHWRVMQCIPQSGESDEENIHRRMAARAYHTATLLQDRYLLIMGGMKSDLSVFDPRILDVNAWVWVNVAVGTGGCEPSGRHGHSVVLDPCRSRLVLFGGGSGSDLLRSGRDNTEVWELQTDRSDWGTNLLATFPWKWRCIHEDREEEEEDGGNNSEVEDEEEEGGGANKLTPVEALNLGRLHIGARVAPDTVIFAFGSGRPSTNGVLAYNLDKDEFFRPAVSGTLPTPRFTAASILVENDGYLFVNGGFATQYGDALNESCVLDLAPALRRNFRSFGIDSNARSHAPVEVAEARVGNARWDINFLMRVLSSSSAAERRGTARILLQQLQESHGGLHQHSQQAMLLTLVMQGNIQFEDEDDASDDGEADEDYVEEDEAENAGEARVRGSGDEEADESDED